MGDACGMLRIIDQHVEHGNLAPPPLGQGLIEVLLIDVHDQVGARAVENAAEGEVVIAGIDIAHQVDAIADFEIKRVRQVAPHDAGGALAKEIALLIVGKGILGVEQE